LEKLKAGQLASLLRKDCTTGGKRGGSTGTILPVGGEEEGLDGNLAPVKRRAVRGKFGRKHKHFSTAN